MIFEIILKILFATVIFCGTTICGMPVVFRFIQNSRWITKVSLSFVAGYIFLSLSGIAANALSINVLITELFVFIVCIIGIIPIRNAIKIELDRNDSIVLALTAIYIIILIAFFDWIIIWMAGDAAAHASIIRMLIDGATVPTSIYPFGNYWDFYPKAFHFYAYFWAKTFTLLDGIQIIPVLITAITPILLYSTVRELQNSELALYVFIFAAFCFPQHYMYLIWAGYPSATAEMLLVAAILLVLIEIRLLPLALLGMFFTHTRFIAFFIGIVSVWGIILFIKEHYSKIKQKRFFIGLGLLLLLVILIITASLFSNIHLPILLVTLITNRIFATEFVTRWLWGLLALFGLIIAFHKRNRLTILFGAWFFAILCLAVLIDIGVFDFIASTDRIIGILYIPLSVFAGVAICEMSHSLPKMRGIFILVLVLIGIFSIGAIFSNYAGSWAMDKADYDSLIWLNDQNFNNTICVNLDGPGEWVYPFTGIMVANSRILPQDPLGNETIMSFMIDNPYDPQVISLLKNSDYSNKIIFISNISISKPGYNPPFLVNGWGFKFILRTSRFDDKNFDLIYSNGAHIFKFNNT